MSDFDVDDRGRTILFHYAATGDIEEVKRIIFRQAGTGMSGQRLSLISHEDNEGSTAADVAMNAGHLEISSLLNSEQGRMEYFE
jgi:hypothetical protein